MNKLIVIAVAAMTAPTQVSAEPRGNAPGKAEASREPQTIRMANGRVARISSPTPVGVSPACPPSIAREDCQRPGQPKKIAAMKDLGSN